MRRLIYIMIRGLVLALMPAAILGVLYGFMWYMGGFE